MRRAYLSGFDATAPVSATISSSVRPRVSRRNTGSLIPLVPCRLQTPRRLEFRATAEPENLRTVANFRPAKRSRAVFLQRIGQIEAQRTKRRIPDQPHTDR